MKNELNAKYSGIEITAVDTFLVEGNCCFVKIRTTEGITGLGEGSISDNKVGTIAQCIKDMEVLRFSWNWKSAPRELVTLDPYLTWPGLGAGVGVFVGDLLEPVVVCGLDPEGSALPDLRACLWG